MNTFYDIPNYEGSYQINMLGEVKSLKRQGTDERTVKGYIDHTGYLRVNLHKDGTSKSFGVHRLVCLVFLPNPENKRTVNHINGNKLDNQISNLEWATHGENHSHAYRKLGRTKHMIGKSGAAHHNAKSVKQINIVTGETHTFATLKEASQEGKFCMGHISACCNGTRKKHKGYYWTFIGPEVTLQRIIDSIKD